MAEIWADKIIIHPNLLAHKRRTNVRGFLTSFLGIFVILAHFDAFLRQKCNNFDLIEVHRKYFTNYSNSPKFNSDTSRTKASIMSGL